MSEVSASALARLLGRDRATCGRWFAEGCPRDLAGAVAWLEARAAARAREPLEARVRELEGAAAGAEVAESDARRRKRVAEAELAELRLAELRGELLQRADVVTTWSTQILAARNRIRAVAKVAVVRLGLSRAQGVALLKLLDEALAALAASDGVPAPRHRRTRRAQHAQ